MRKTGRMSSFMLGLLSSAMACNIAIASNTQQSSGYIQEAPNVFSASGEFTGYFFQVTTDSSGNAVAPKVPVGSSTGACGHAVSKSGALTWTSGMSNSVDTCTYNVYAVNIKFPDGTWWTIVNPNVVAPNTKPQALATGCAGNIIYANDGLSLVYNDPATNTDPLGCKKQTS
ncbi:MAG: hypothetical protein JSR33_07200 [Proteobacteria bacterium]|nr:hypothetical protein [Pseudomonadota bacterium]